jgi:hypothetical protein
MEYPHNVVHCGPAQSARPNAREHRKQGSSRNVEIQGNRRMGSAAFSLKLLSFV